MSTTVPFRGASRAADYLDTTDPTERTPETEPPTVGFAPAGPVADEEVTAPDLAVEVPLEPSEHVEPESFDLRTLGTTRPSPLATTGLRGLAARVGIRMQPSAAEIARTEQLVELRAAEDVIRQTTWPRAVGILVANRKGGVGKTPIAVILGGTLAAIRGGSVAIMEVSDDPGTLTFRAEGNPRRGIGELVTDADHIASAGQLASYTAPQTSFASVIGTVGSRRQLHGDDVRRTVEVIDRYYGIRVMDSGNQPTSTAFEGALDTADTLVIPVLNTAEAVLEAIALLDHLRTSDRYAGLADTATVLRLTDGRPEQPELLDRLDESLAQHRVGQVFQIPFDAHIAERGPITLDRLAPATRTALTLATAGIVRTLRSIPVPIH